MWRKMAGMIAPRVRLAIWDWAERNIVYPQKYKALAPGPYSVARTPFWKGPMDDLLDPAVKEVWILKSAQAACSENMILMPMRYAVECLALTMVYIGGAVKATEEYIRERIKPGLQLSAGLRSLWREADVVEHNVYYPHCMVVCGWCSDPNIFKMRPVDWAFADEVSVWGTYAPEALRKRVSTRPFSKIIGMSSMDGKQRRPTEEDPIWVEFQDTDQRYYWLRDPVTGSRFRFEMGWREKDSETERPWGLKWDRAADLGDGKYDMALVRASAHYVTPDGSVIDEVTRDRLMLEEAGAEWVAERPDAPEGKRGYYISSFYMPWISFGDIACSYLSALKRGPQTLRTWIYENVRGVWTGETTGAEATEVEQRQGPYGMGESFSRSAEPVGDGEVSFAEFYASARRIRFMTVDVQRDHKWWSVREWVTGGDSGLVAYGACVRYSEVDELARKHGVAKVFVDAGDGDEQWDIYQACLQFRFIPTQGVENLDEPFRDVTIDPKTGKHTARLRGSSRKGLITVLRFRTSPFKHKLLQRVTGKPGPRWWVYSGIERGYCEQLSSEQWNEQVQQWETREGITRNHLWDCEVYQMLAAVRFGFAEGVE